MSALSPSLPRSRIRPASSIPRDAICLGTEVQTGAPFWILPEALTRGVHLRGAIGSGKTSVIRQLLVGRGVGAPWVHFDYIGTGHRELQAWIATVATAIAVAEDVTPALAGATAALLRRFAFLTIGAPNPPVRVDLLRRRMLPDGRREYLRDVVSRAVEVLYVKLNDADAAQRVRFHRIATALVTVLAAANRPIAEGLILLDDPGYISFVDRAIETQRFRASEITYLQHQRAELAHVLRLRPDDPRKSWHAFEDETSSTRNGLVDFMPGTVLGDLFNDESLPLEDVAFGRTCLSVTNREAEDLQKVKAYQTIHAMLHALFLHRKDMQGVPSLVVICDEPWWMRRNLPGILAVSRNLAVSYLISHQSDAQWEDIGLRTMPQQLRALTNLAISFRPTSFADAEDEVLHTTEIEPDGLVQRFWTSSFAENDGSSSTTSRSWANVLRYAGAGAHPSSSATSGEGDASSFSSGSSVGEHEVLNVVGFGDQVKYRAQAALRRPRFRGVVISDGRGTEVDFASPPVFPHVFAGVPILELFQRFHDASWRARTIARSPHDPHIVIENAQRTASAQARADDAPAARSMTPAAVSEPPLPVRAPVAPPAFGVASAAPTNGARSTRRRRRPRRKGHA